MSKRILKITTGILIFSAMIFTNLNGQERNDVITAYNEGAKAIQTDVNLAIKSFENVITLSDKVGEEAADLKQKATQILPGLYVRAASNALSEKKPAAEVIRAAKIASAAAEKYESEQNKQNAQKLLISGYYNLGTGFFSSKEYDNSLLAFDSLLAINPDYNTAIYNKALVYRIQNNNEKFEETIDLFLSKLDAGKDEARAKQASSMALEYFRAAGSQAIQADNIDEGITLLDKAAKYGEDKDLFYFFADAYNKKNNFDSGLEYAQKGLDLETGDAEAKAKFYYQLAVAQAGKGDTSSACTSFKNALYGPFAEAAKAQRINLKCE